MGGEYLIHVLLYLPDQTNFTSVRFGVYYHSTPGTGFDVLEFHSCGANTTPIGDWPSTYGSEVVMTYASCQTAGPDGIELGWFSVSVDDPDQFSLRPWELFAPGGVPRLVDCDLNETFIPPQNVGEIAFDLGPGFDPCTDPIDTSPGVCCFGDSCQEVTDLACCWTNQGFFLGPDKTCPDCIVKAMPRTWGQLKARYE